MALRLDCTSLFAQDRSLALHALTGTVADSALICMDTAAGGCAAPIQRRLRCAAPQSADEASAVTGTAARGVLWVPSARALARPRARPDPGHPAGCNVEEQTRQANESIYCGLPPPLSPTTPPL
ncbi:unnamed protein product [Lampetra planeri]